MIQLVFHKNGQALFKRVLDQSVVSVGRDISCDIQLLDPEISRQHCSIEKQNGFFTLKDLSRNGTFVNEKKAKEVLLHPKDRIQIGPWVLNFTEEKILSPKETLIREKPKQKMEESLGPMLGRSRAMKEAFELIRKASVSDINVCLIGETGTGKELAARLIHDLSIRHDKPFVAVNCGAIPENLIESLLFGHEKGAFTGATDRHTGVFEEANQGTLFLDEIGEMPLDLQTRLLRILETQTLRRVGGKNDIQVNVRLVAATNRDLKRCVGRGEFRQDLFYRLYIFPITFAPLRERREDILLLAEHFLVQLSLDGMEFSFSEEAKQKLKNHEWQGNVRELKNVIQRSILLTQKETVEAGAIDLSDVTRTPAEIGELKLGDQEKLSILTALRKFKGHYSQVSRHLGIARTTLASKIRRYKIDPKNIS